MLRHACISLALLLALGTAAPAQVDSVANDEGCPAAATPGDPHELPIRKYQRLLDCTKQALADAETRLNQLSDVKLDDFAHSLLDSNQGLKSQLNLKNDRIKQLETEAADKDKTIAELNTRVDDLEDEVEDLKAEVTRLQGVVDHLQAALDNANKENADLRTQIETCMNEARGLNQRISDLDSELAAARDTIAEQASQIADLKCDVGRLTNERSAFYSDLQRALGNDPRIRIVGDTFIMPLDILFKVGSAELSHEGWQRIDTIAPLVVGLEATVRKDVDWVLEVHGHTDVQPYRFTRKFPMNNWQLSAARALAVVDRLEKMGVDGKRLVASGHSKYRPIDLENTQEAYAVNRRVEFKLDEYSRQLSPQEPCPPLPEVSEEEEEG
jgi:chemotaxis protein MotB